MNIPSDILQRFHTLSAKELKALMTSIRVAAKQNPEAMAAGANKLDVFYRKPKAAVCPIFREYHDSVEQFGSGVLLSICGVKFLLTVSHVTDQHEGSTLFIPGKKHLIPISGLLADMKMPATGNRADDRYDIAYYRLDTECIDQIHDNLEFCLEEDCDLHDTTSFGDPYTIIGYPSRKSLTKGNIVQTEILSLTGKGVTDHRIRQMGRNIQHHILIQYRRNHATNYRTFSKSLVCLPEGMSGGGVFAWHKDLPDPKVVAQPKLVGIVTDYHQGKNVFIATRLNCFVRCIAKNNPNLPISSNSEPFSHQGSLRRPHP